MNTNTLTKIDRCDACGSARATVRTAHVAGDLLWCTHHYNAKAHALSSRVVEDIRAAVEAENATTTITSNDVTKADQ